MKDAALLILIVVAALAIRVEPVEESADSPTRTVFPSVMATPAVAAPAEPDLLLVDVEALEIAAVAADAQPLAMRSLEDLEVVLTDGELEEMTLTLSELVHAMVLGAAQGPATELLSQAAEVALEAAAPASPCRSAG